MSVGRYFFVFLGVLALAGSANPTAIAADGAEPPAYGPGSAASGAGAPIALPASPMVPQNPPNLSLPPSDTRPFEKTRATHELLAHQWSLTREIPPESVISESYLKTRDTTARSLSLKEAIYLALANNPAVQAARLDPLASLEAVSGSSAVFDPDLTARLDVLKNVLPTTSTLQTGGAIAFAQKQYDWNIAVNKLLSSTNGTFGVSFNNNRVLSNSFFSAVNPNYNPTLNISLSQPLLRNFGLDFATINLRVAETNQKQAQFNYEQQLADFVERVAGDYWNVVRAEENLQVARDALKLAQDLVRQNQISVKVGVLAPIAIKESQSEEATREAAVFQAEDALTTARAILRQDVMVNPASTFMPQQVEPADRPSITVERFEEEEALEFAMQYRPELASMREAIRSLLLQVKYAENQTLPQLNFGGQIGTGATAGTSKCNALFGGIGNANCTVASTLGPVPGNRLPFGGVYSDALNRLWNFSFYNYAAVLSVERPLDNDASKAALAQTKIEYEQQRLRYRDAISQIIVDVEHSLSALTSDIKRVNATRVATEYAEESLRSEQERYRVGIATTHELLQFQDSLTAARGNQVAAEIDLELAKLSLKHAEGRLLDHFKINFEVQEPDVRPWYAKF